MSIYQPRRFNSGYNTGSRSGVRVGQKWVTSPVPRAGFRPSKFGNGYYKRRTY